MLFNRRGFVSFEDIEMVLGIFGLGCFGKLSAAQLSTSAWTGSGIFCLISVMALLWKD
jgi:hypothetical protein